jgi:hypothetical protein
MLRELQAETEARAGHANGELKEAKHFARTYQTIQPEFQKNKGHTARGDALRGDGEKRRKQVGAGVESREERRRRLKAAGFEAFSKAPLSASQRGGAAKALEGSEDSKEPPTEKNEKKTDQTTRVEPTTRAKRKTDDDAAVLDTGGGAEGGRAGGGAEEGARGSSRAPPPAAGKKRKKYAGRGAEGEGASDISEREFEDIVSHLQRTVASSDGGREKSKNKRGARLPPQSGSRDQRYCIWYMGLHTAAIYVSSYCCCICGLIRTCKRRIRQQRLQTRKGKKQKAIADEEKKKTESTPLLHGSEYCCLLSTLLLYVCPKTELRARGGKRKKT